MARRPGVTELSLVSGTTSRWWATPQTPSSRTDVSTARNRCRDDVHRGHYLPTHQRVQGFRQSSQPSFGRHWKLRSSLRQQRTIEVAHHYALNVGSCFELWRPGRTRPGGRKTRWWMLRVTLDVSLPPVGPACRPHSELCPTFVACGWPFAFTHRTLAAPVIVATLTRRTSSRLRLRQQGGRAIQASLRDRSTWPPPSLRASLLTRAESSHPHAQYIDRTRLRPAALFRWRSAATQRDSVHVDTHRLHTFLPWSHSWRRVTFPCPTDSKLGCEFAHLPAPLGSRRLGPRVGPESASGKMIPSVGAADASVPVGRHGQVLEAGFFLAPGCADIKTGPKPVGAESGQAATKSVQPGPNHSHAAWKCDVSLRFSK